LSPEVGTFLERFSGRVFIQLRKAMSKKDLNRGPAAVAKCYEPTPEERAALESVRKRWKRTPRVTASSDENAHHLKLDHPQQDYAQWLLMDALGTAEPDFWAGIIPQIAKAATRDGKVDEVEMNFVVSVIKGISPKDQLETLLAAQMGVVHTLFVSFAHRLANAKEIQQQDFAERTVNKLARTFAAQVETLKRYRSNGEQKVTVEHVTVNEGGKAIVGNVTHRGAGSSEKRETSS
jgi:hypothetical protein